jgi:hypothetical protein
MPGGSAARCSATNRDCLVTPKDVAAMLIHDQLLAHKSSMSTFHPCLVSARGSLRVFVVAALKSSPLGHAWRRRCRNFGLVLI